MSLADYSRIERAIEFLDRHAGEHPELADVAAHVGLSPYHFQRLFTRWAGISPKRFTQFQTLVEAKALLAANHSVLDTSFQTGLSGGSRLHDLFVTIESATPGEYREGGVGIELTYGVHDTPFGKAFIVHSAGRKNGRRGGIACIRFLSGRGYAELLEEVKADWPNAAIRYAPAITAPYIRQIFRASTADRPLSVLVRGTNFQVKVWEALLHIPAGDLASYEDVATAIGRPTAVRAVASAVARNPVAFLIPCHRVIRKTGAFGEYRWGAARKRAMLIWEGARRDDGETVGRRWIRTA
jgi:AraC family transcriptional regulator, regulatory protein of adaptative response / methylated-DNA-[protein]-cysteine methyltransferase